MDLKFEIIDILGEDNESLMDRDSPENTRSLIKFLDGLTIPARQKVDFVTKASCENSDPVFFRKTLHPEKAAIILDFIDSQTDLSEDEKIEAIDESGLAGMLYDDMKNGATENVAGKIQAILDLNSISLPQKIRWLTAESDESEEDGEGILGPISAWHHYHDETFFAYKNLIAPYAADPAINDLLKRLERECNVDVREKMEQSSDESSTSSMEEVPEKMQAMMSTLNVS